MSIKEEVLKRSEIINRAISEYLPVKEPEGLYNAARHLINAGGKRLRPVMCLISAEAVGGDVESVIPAAVAIETIHNFTLIHDDIMDRDELRRGVPTVHVAYDEPTAILAGDTLFAEAFKILSSCNVEAENLVKASRMLADVCIEICEGQYLDMSFEKREKISESEYLEMVRKKTAVLIASACAMPAVLFGMDSYAKALWNFGIYSGIGFQIHDDVLDITGKDKIGKDWGSDIVEGKKTLIMIKAMELGVEIEIFGRGSASVEEIEEAVEKLKECGALDYARQKAQEYVERGKRELDVLPDSKAKSLLIELADYLVTREY
ncbi:polyprenyl synthetase family protein [Archaeoglobus veneficus]|uniref:Polyprenyl synthetase n=1 Tax=Archaeoglobus veneficus (strain DSM 11195 / SNP6) TaxID=693661 RepID=F2KQR1_ARCVS|nr:polyprenyl synthetase family protein [Archaeoglobus veneficus]AEA46623.1 Polyprenyl synthetase [Archaeoglobus veneficus SNP6]